jgi:hypothetical protein
MFKLFNGIISVYTKNFGVLIDVMTQVQDNIVTMYQKESDLYFFEVYMLTQIQLNYLKKTFKIEMIDSDIDSSSSS